jgi:hypothetical protein
VKLPVVFKSKGVTKTFNRQPDGRGKEGDSIGVWKDGSSAWKLYPKQADFTRLSTFYHQAAVNGLPMGDPSFKEGSIQQGTDRASNGFALVTRWLDGIEFNFHTPPKKFNTALRDEKISHSKSSTQYKRIHGGCVSADKIGLVDIQGKVNGKAGAYEPVAFFDVHTSKTSRKR